jgi:anti-repressor protein
MQNNMEGGMENQKTVVVSGATPEVFEVDGERVVDARTLHGALGVNTVFAHWVERNFGEFEEGAEFLPKVAKSTGGRPETNYWLTLDTAKELCMMAKTPQGKAIRKYFIAVEREWRQKMSAAPELSRRQLAEMVIKAEDERERIAAQNAALIAQQEKAAEFAESEFVPALEYVTRAVKTGNNGELDTKDTANEMRFVTVRGENIGRDGLFDICQKIGWTCAGDRTRATQYAINSGYLVVKETTSRIPDRHGNCHTSVKIFFTVKGRKRLLEILLGLEHIKETPEVRRLSEKYCALLRGNEPQNASLFCAEVANG